MQRSTPLATCVGRVQQRFDEAVEDALEQKLNQWLGGSPSVRRRLGDPSTIALESELVAVLGARLSAVTWSVVPTATTREDSQIIGPASALRLLLSVFKAVHGGDAVAPADSSAQPNTRVLQALLRQACASLLLDCGANCLMPATSDLQCAPCACRRLGLRSAVNSEGSHRTRLIRGDMAAD